jgi:hypothetical protein
MADAPGTEAGMSWVLSVIFEVARAVLYLLDGDDG